MKLYESIRKNLKESDDVEYKLEYWATYEDRDQGFSDTLYLDEAKDDQEAIAETKKYCYREDWESCELYKGDELIFGIYPDEDGGEVNYLEESEKPSGKVGKTYICKKKIEDPFFGTLLGVNEVVTITNYDALSGYLSDVSDFWITEDMMKNNLEEYNGPVFGCYNQDDELLSKQSTKEDAEEYKREREEWSDDKVYIEEIKESNLKESEHKSLGKMIKESAYANNKLLDAVRDYGIVSVNLDEMNNTITFRVPRKTDGNDGYVCATIDFIERVESALRDMGVDADVFGEGESATDFGTFTLTYVPKSKGLYGESENSAEYSVVKDLDDAKERIKAYIDGYLENGDEFSDKYREKMTSVYKNDSLLAKMADRLLNKGLTNALDINEEIHKMLTESSMKESDDIEVLGFKNQYGYTVNQVYINYPERTYEVGSITMRNDKTISRKDFYRTIERLKQMGFKEVKRGMNESSIPRNAKRIKVGDFEYSKDGSNWKKNIDPEEMSFGVPVRYGNDFLRGQGDIEVLEVDENYKPKRTKEYRVLQGNYGYGWDDLVSYDVSDKQQMADLRQNVKDYRENEPQYSHRVITRRMPIDEADVLKKGSTFKESDVITIWDSETTEDDYDPEFLQEQYQEYVDNFDGTVKPDDYDDWLYSDWLYNYLDYDFTNGDFNEWYDFINNYDKESLKLIYEDYLEEMKEREPNKPKDFEDWKYDYIADDSWDQWNMKLDDLANNIYPMIDEQINNDILIVSGHYSSNYPDFRPSGAGGKLLNKAEDILDWLEGEDRITFSNEDGVIGVSAFDHDGSIGGSLYTLPDDDNLLLEIAKATDYYDIDGEDSDILSEFKYDITNGNIDMTDLRDYADKFVPIKVNW